MTAYRILTVDASYLARSRFEAGGLIPGFLATVIDLQRDWGVPIVFVAWDSPTGSGPRKVASPAYKAKREDPPPAFDRQVAELRQVLPWFGVTRFEASGGEADDVIATIARTYPGPHLLWSADKDLLQLVGPGVSLLRARPGKGREGAQLIDATNIREVEARIQGEPCSGLSAAGWLDLQTLAGDSTDGVAGVRGIGPKLGLKLLQADPRIVSGILAGARTTEWEPAEWPKGQPESIRKLANKVVRQRAALATSRALVQLYSVELEVQLAAPDREAATAWLLERELGWLVRRWWPEEPPADEEGDPGPVEGPEDPFEETEWACSIGQEAEPWR